MRLVLILMNLKSLELTTILEKKQYKNLMVLRFTNNLYENAWNAQNIDNVQITVSENIGVGSRGDFL